MIKNRVFISYAKEDKVEANRLFLLLKQNGANPWMDCEDLLPGQNWDAAIIKAISESRYFLPLLSSRSVTKKGYVQKEIRQALAIADEYPPDEIYIIPVRIDECETSYPGLMKLHRTDMFSDYEEGVKALLRAIKYEVEEEPVLVKREPKVINGVIDKLADRGFGFIKAGDESIFFHSNGLEGVTFDELREGDVVTFLRAESRKGSVALSVNVRRA